MNATPPANMLGRASYFRNWPSGDAPIEAHRAAAVGGIADIVGWPFGSCWPSPTKDRASNDR
jgi:hypothetical protein